MVRMFQDRKGDGDATRTQLRGGIYNADEMLAAHGVGVGEGRDFVTTLSAGAMAGGACLDRAADGDVRGTAQGEYDWVWAPAAGGG